ASAIPTRLASRVMTLPIAAVPLSTGLTTGTLAAAAGIARLERRGVARKRAGAGAGIGARGDGHCRLWLLNRHVVDVVSERAQRLHDRVAGGAEAMVGLVIVDAQLDRQLPADRLQIRGDRAELGRVQLDLQRAHRLQAALGLQLFGRNVAGAPALLAGDG